MLLEKSTRFRRSLLLLIRVTLNVNRLGLPIQMTGIRQDNLKSFFLKVYIVVSRTDGKPVVYTDKKTQNAYESHETREIYICQFLSFCFLSRKYDWLTIGLCLCS